MENNSLKSRILNCAWLVLQHTMPTKAYLKLKYRVVFKQSLNLDNPQTYSEKLQWIKLYGYRPEHTVMVDKVLVKEYVRNIIGDEYIIPTLAVWDTPDDMDFDSLPDRFVLKCNHDSGRVVICRDKGTFDRQKAFREMKASFRHNYYLMGRETPYKYVNRKVFAEQFMQDDVTSDIRDYKFFCFDGEPKAMFVASERATDVKFDFYDMEFNHLPLRQGYDHSPYHVGKPENFELMKELAAKLSKGIPHVRVDLYEINGKVYFGELTFFHFSGFMPFEPADWDKTWGDWLTLPKRTDII